MRRWERRLGRTAGGVGAGAGVAYLFWRVSSSLSGVSPWISVPALLVEVVGVIGTCLLTWALWTRPEPRWTPSAPTGSGPGDDRPTPVEAAPVSVMVTSARRDLPWLRATVLAARPLGAITVVDLADRDDVRDLAAELGLAYLPTEPDDLNGLAAFAARCDTPVFLQLDAGDIPHPGIVERLRPHLAAPGVAIVQAVGAAASDDSAEHTQSGRHVRDAERLALNPALGMRGVGMFLGSGALVRTAELREIDPGTSSPPMAQAAVTAALFAAGRRIVVPGTDPLIAVDPLLVANDAEMLHACEASAARSLLRGELGALRPNRLKLHQRLAMVTWSIRPLSGVRRTIIVALIIHALLSGRLPLALSLPALAATWLPWFVCSSIGLFLLSGRTLRPGDRGRAAFRALGTSWRGLWTPNGRPEQPRRIVGGVFGLHHGVAPTAAVTSISVVLGLRGLSDRFTHTLAPMDGREMAVLLTVALWSLWSALDALRLLARRTQSRRARRVTASLPCTMLDQAALIIDLTALGAGVLSDTEAQPGDTLRLDVVVPTVTGCTTARISAVVRNVRLDFNGGHRLGVQFGDVDAYVADTLAEYCILQPGLEVLGTAPDIDRSEVHPIVVVDPERGGPRRLGLRAAALVAVAGALASAVPQQAEASELSTMVHGQVVDAGVAPDAPTQPVEGAVALVVCALEPGADLQFGSNDDRFVGPRTAVTGPDGGYDVPVAGAACWVTVSLPAGHLARRTAGELSPVSDVAVVSLSDHHALDVRAAVASSVASPVAPSDASSDASSVEPVLVTDAVFADLDGDGERSGGEPGVAGVTVTVYAEAGTVLGRTVTGDDGAFAFSVAAGSVYRLGVSELPDGWRAVDPTGMSVSRAATTPTGAGIGVVDATVTPAATALPTRGGEANPGAPAPTPSRLLPAPRPTDLAEPTDSGIPSGVAAMIIAIAALLAVSVLAGSLLPFRHRRPASADDGWGDGRHDDWGGGWGTGQSSSPDLAMR